MNRCFRKVYVFLAIIVLIFPLAGCGNDEDEADKGKEEQGVHKPIDDYEKTGNVNRLEDEK